MILFLQSHAGHFDTYDIFFQNNRIGVTRYDAVQNYGRKRTYVEMVLTEMVNRS
jgi:hypothetical protein